MVQRKPLRVVAADEKSPEPKTLLEAVAAGDYLAELKATHHRIAKTVAAEGTSPRDLAALTRRQLEISKEIRALELVLQEEREDAREVADETWDAEAL